MSKKRKTRKEKMKAVIRTQESLSRESVPVYSIDVPQPLQPRTVPKVNEKSGNYTYVVTDMRQTFIITSILLTASVILYFLIQNQILRFTMFGY
jgi:hypothetical protein